MSQVGHDSNLCFEVLDYAIIQLMGMASLDSHVDATPLALGHHSKRAPTYAIMAYNQLLRLDLYRLMTGGRHCYLDIGCIADSI